MIEIYDWKKEVGTNLLDNNQEKMYDITFSCPEKFDDRSDWSTSYIAKISKEVIDVSYSHENVSLMLGGNQYSLRNFDSISYPDMHILIDATVFPLPELLHLFSIFEKNNQSFDVLYVQPMEYSKNTDDEGIEKIETYKLSDDGIGPQQLPPFVNYSINSSLFVCLGFEGHRFGALVHSDEYDTSNMTSLIGIPAFKAGWENKALENNFKVMADAGLNASPNYKIAGANDPLSTYEIISKVYNSACYQGRTLCLAPFGTKPTAIAAAWFAVNHKNVVMIYDFVQKRKKMSHGTDTVHLWKFRPKI